MTKIQIYTGSSNPVSQKPYPIAIKHYDWVKDEINMLLDAKSYAVVTLAGQLPS